jgi:hypothetical protein
MQRVLSRQFGEDDGHHGTLGEGDDRLLGRVRQQIGSLNPSFCQSPRKRSRLMHGVRVGKQQPLRARFLGAGNHRIVLSCPILGRAGLPY